MTQTQANPQTATLKHATLKHATLDYATLKHATLDYATLEHATLQRATLQCGGKGRQAGDTAFARKTNSQTAPSEPAAPPVFPFWDLRFRDLGFIWDLGFRDLGFIWDLGFPTFRLRTLALLALSALSLSALALLACPTTAHAQTRESFDLGWRFAKDDHPGAENPAFNDTPWRALDVPHDWSIEGPYDKDAPTGGPGGYLPAGIGWYRKTFRIPETAQGKKITIQFDGVYMDSTVWLNGRKLGTQPYGYTTFEYDLTPHLHHGARDNIIAVRVDNSRQPNSRWYSGSGIYRHTWLRTTDPLHIPAWGVCVTTPQISTARATINARITVRNDTPASPTTPASRPTEVTLAILDPSGAIVAEATAEGRARSPSAPPPTSPAPTHSPSHSHAPSPPPSPEIPPGAELEFTADLTLPRPRLWSPEKPRLYRLRATVSTDGRATHISETTFGVRAIEYTIDRGFLLNGKKVIMRGMCLHHDAGSVGAAVPEPMLRRRLELLKEMGCNAVRTSHNPMAPEFYQMCDELGLLVMAEPFDEWTIRKGALTFGYSDHYKDWHERDLVAHIRQTRNHPSIVIWSAGNEINEQDTPGGEKVLKQLVDIFHREDPTRPVTAAVSRAYTDKGHAPLAFTDLLDIMGYNYIDRWGIRRELQYSLDRVLFPQRKMIGTENASASGDRGNHGFGPLARNTPKGRDYTGEPTPGSPQGATYPALTLRAQSLWKFLATHDYVAGDFAWTGFDYLGEATWPRKLSSSGPLDTCGFKKDSYYFYQSIWTTKPMIHLLPHWNWEGRESQPIPVLAFTNANFAELFINGRSLGVKAKEFPRQGTKGGFRTYARPVVQITTTDLHFTWDVPYEPGELRAVAYDYEGKIIAETRIATAAPPAALELTADRPTLAAGARDIAHVTIRALDAAGQFVPIAKDKITLELSGPATLIGVDNGNPSSHESYKATTRHLYAGLALAILQSAPRPGPIKLTARAPGLREATIEITSQ